MNRQYDSIISLEEDIDEAVQFDGICLNIFFKEYPLKKYLCHSNCLLKIIQTVDIITVETDNMSIVNSLCESLQMDNDYYQILKYRNMAKNFQSFLFNLLNDHFEATQFNNMTLIELLNKLWPLNHLKRICRDIYLKQNDILVEFQSKKQENKIKIGLFYHDQTANKEKVNLFKQISEEETFEIIDLSSLALDFVKSVLKSVCYVFILFDKFLCNSFEETNSNEDRNQLIGKILYREYLNQNKNFRFYTFIIDDEKQFSVDDLTHFKYMWLLREIEINQNDKRKLQLQKPFNIKHELNQHSKKLFAPVLRSVLASIRK